MGLPLELGRFTVFCAVSFFVILMGCAAGSAVGARRRKSPFGASPTSGFPVFPRFDRGSPGSRVSAFTEGGESVCPQAPSPGTRTETAPS